jgi:hypothetical protein
MQRIVEQIRYPRLFVYVLIAIMMCGYDAMATMRHISRGVAAEGNPLMGSLIEHNAVAFFWVKMAMTVPCLILCYAYSNLRAARVGIRFALAAYSILCVYHLAIVFLVK